MNEEDTGDRSPEAAEPASGQLPPFQDNGAALMAVGTAVLAPAWLERLDAPDALATVALGAALREALASGPTKGFAGLPEAFAGLGDTGAQPGRRWEVSVALGDDALLRRLNRDYRSQDKATNVLAFPTIDPTAAPLAAPLAAPAGDVAAEVSLGDIVLALETISWEAAAQGKRLEDHLCHLLIHGFLHLLGMDHQTATQADAMEALEIAALARLRIANPYLPEAAPKAAAGQGAGGS